MIDLILREAERAPWQAIGWAHQLGELGGDARLAGMEPVWMIGQKSQAGAVRGGEARTTKERDRRLAEAFLSKRENAKKETSDTEIKRAIGRSNKMKGEAARKAIDRGLRLLGKI